jgi:elongation factor P
MTLKATELRKGMVLEKDNDLLLITEYSHATPGNLRAVIQVKTRSLTTGSNKAFRPAAGDQFEQAYLKKTPSQYLYQEANGDYVFNDQETYEQFMIPKDQIVDKMWMIKESELIDVTFHEEKPISIELPTTVTLEVTWAEMAVKGNTATNVKKEAKVETGKMIKVPLHIKEGERIVISTETGEFQKRSQD